MIAVCPSESNGLPTWWPRGKLTKTARGGLTDAVMSRAEEREMVGRTVYSI
jgi:hypothetical protein